jgi:hypothetical protein
LILRQRMMPEKLQGSGFGIRGRYRVDREVAAEREIMFYFKRSDAQIVE